MEADRQARGWAPWVVLLLALGPAAAAVWLTPWFVTQDGPAHLYNAEILRAALRFGERSPYARAYLPRWSPVPNWGGHLVLMGLLELAPPRVADRLMTTLTMLAVPVSLLWLRGQVRGRGGQRGAAVGAAVLGLSFPWLLGFGAFLLGMAVGLVTLGCWWRWKDRLGFREMLAIGALLVAGYLGHLVALGLTAMGLAILAVTTRGNRPDRIARTALAMLPLGPLAVLYKTTTAGSGSFGPTWEHLTSWAEPRAWARQLGWADPITLGRRAYAPLWEGAGPWAGWLLIAPALWFLAGLAGAALWGRGRECRPWAWLAAALLAGALVGPDSFGADHGHYLPQRLALFGLAAGVVAVGAPGRHWGNAAVVGAWTVALAAQTLTVWDYARESSERVGALMAASGAVGEGKNVGTLLVEPRGRFRANPLLHADCLLGVGTGNIVWSNYETRFYYFPVQVRPDVPAPPAGEFEEIAIMAAPADQAERARRWGALLRRHGPLIDRVVVFGDPGEIEVGGPVRFAEGPVRVAETGGVAVSRRE